jgi:hypothetical protein
MHLDEHSQLGLLIKAQEGLKLPKYLSKNYTTNPVPAHEIPSARVAPYLT